MGTEGTQSLRERPHWTAAVMLGSGPSRGAVATPPPNVVSLVLRLHVNEG